MEQYQGRVLAKRMTICGRQTPHTIVNPLGREMHSQQKYKNALHMKMLLALGCRETRQKISCRLNYSRHLKHWHHALPCDAAKNSLCAQQQIILLGCPKYYFTGRNLNLSFGRVIHACSCIKSTHKVV